MKKKKRFDDEKQHKISENLNKTRALTLYIFPKHGKCFFYKKNNTSNNYFKMKIIDDNNAYILAVKT